MSAHWAAAFRHADFDYFQGARFLSLFGSQMQNVAIGWQVYAITERPLDLGLVGLAQFAPAAALSLVTGHASDRFDRRRILAVCHAAMAACSLALYAIARAHDRRVALVYAVLVLVGLARAFIGPANQSILPSLVPPDHFANAVAWGSSIWQVALVLGPAIGGGAYAWAKEATPVYLASAVCSLVSLALVSRIRARGNSPRDRRATSWTTLLAGIDYVWRNKVVLGAISLDLFAVLLGGAVALLPVFARDVLALGPWALGVLRSAPAVGAALTAVVLALRPIARRSGVKMFAGVALYGAATIVFGFSRSFVLSLAALVVVGAADMVSVYVRAALVQLATPDAMRGRVSAVNMVFIGASNELGELESGLTAQWLGTVPAVVLGGAGTHVVVGLWMALFPSLRRVDRLDDVRPAALS
jgi:MFS family permease